MDANFAHVIVGHVLVILAKDETKVKGRVYWELKSSTLVGFCDVRDVHLCTTNFKPIVGKG